MFFGIGNTSRVLRPILVISSAVARETDINRRVKCAHSTTLKYEKIALNKPNPVKNGKRETKYSNLSPYDFLLRIIIGSNTYRKDRLEESEARCQMGIRTSLACKDTMSTDEKMLILRSSTF